MTKTRPFLSMCYGDPSATEVPPCCETATKKLTFSTTSVLLLLNMPLSLSRATIFRRQKNPRRVYRPKMNRKVNTILCPSVYAQQGPLASVRPRGPQTLPDAAPRCGHCIRYQSILHNLKPKTISLAMAGPAIFSRNLFHKHSFSEWQWFYCHSSYISVTL